MVFFYLFYWSGYWIIKYLILLFLNIVAPPKQTCSQRSKTYCLYNQDIKRTKWQITVIIEKREEDFYNYCYFSSDHRYISQYNVYCLISVRHIKKLLLCVIWMISACNVIFNIGTGMENVTHLKNRTIFRYGAFRCGPASEPLARH